MPVPMWRRYAEAVKAGKSGASLRARLWPPVVSRIYAVTHPSSPLHLIELHVTLLRPDDHARADKTHVADYF